VASFVLGRFTTDEEIELGRVLDRAAALLEQGLRTSAR
jgi:peptidyl-tRNA hydrolase